MKLMGSAVLLLLVAITTGSASVVQVSYSLEENKDKGYFVGNLVTKVKSGSTNFTFGNTTDTPLCSKYFKLLPNGEIQTNISIDRENLVEITNRDSLTCWVNYVYDQTTCSLLVTFNIQDINDVVPTFFGLNHPVHTLNIFENLATGQPIEILMPYDLDKGANGTVNYTIIKGNEDGYFELHRILGDNERSPDRILYLAKKLNRKNVQSYNITFRIADQGPNQLTSTQQLLIKVQNVNVEIPSFNDKYSFEVPEDQPVGKDYSFGRINATDDDSAIHSQIFYFFDNSSQFRDLFAVNVTTGELYLLKSIDYDSASSYPIEYEFHVEARNPASLVGTDAHICVTIIDVNDEIPRLIDQGFNKYEIQENENFYQFVAAFKDNDKHIPNNNISNGTVSFVPNVAHSEVTVEYEKDHHFYFLFFKITEPLDREKTPYFELTISVADKGTPPLTSHTNVTINVTDINDNAPQFTEERFIGKIAKASEPKKYVLTISARDPDEGINGRFYFMIDSVSPDTAWNWFSINASSGQLFLTANRSYISDVNGKIEINVSAKDYGNDMKTNKTTVEVTVIGSITLQPNAFQEYSKIDLISSSIVYVEFRTDRNESDALLLYQHSNSFQQRATLQIKDKKLVYSSNNNVLENDVHLYQNRWYSALINKNDQGNPVKVWERGTRVDPVATELLQNSELNSCTNQTDKDSDSPLFVGGVENIFTTSDGTVLADNFIGEIATVIIDNVQLDTSCPFKQQSVLNGSHFSPLCTNEPDKCNQYSTCVSYIDNDEMACQCKSGLPPSTCSNDTDFGIISMTGGSHIEFELGYSYFYHTRSSSNYPAGSNVIQTINISLVPANDNFAGVLFYSKTDSSVQLLEVVDKTIRYTVQTVNYEPLWSLVTEEVNFVAGVKHDLVLQIMSGDQLGSILFGLAGSNLTLWTRKKDTSESNPCMLFAKPSKTTISLGGISDSEFSQRKESFSGCITKFAIDNTQLPLRGFIETLSQNLTIHGSMQNVSLSCHPCFQAKYCSINEMCEIQEPLYEDEYHCVCQEGYELRGDSCILPTQEPVSSSSTQEPVSSSFTQEPVSSSSTQERMSSSSKLPPTASNIRTEDIENPTSGKMALGAIIGMAIGSLVGLFVLVLMVVCLGGIIRWCVKEDRKKHSIHFVTQVTYHQNTSDNQESIDSIDKSVLSSPTKKHSYMQTTIKNRRCSSSEIDGDSVIDEFTSQGGCRKSTSQETGFHTASEMEAHSRQSSPRRTYDSGKSSSDPYDSDLETDSESLNTSGIEDALSPNEMRLVSSGSTLGVPSSFRKNNPLNSKERIMLVPLRPNSGMLLTEDETDTEISTTTNTTNRPMGNNDNDSIISDPNGPKWYKSSSPSTIVSNDSSAHYCRHAVDTQKHHRRRMFPPTLRHQKSSSPPHYYMQHDGHTPSSSSPLVQKAHCFEYPPPYNNSPTTNHPFHYENMDPNLYRLPVIDESAQYSHQTRYQPPNSHSSYMEMEMRAVPAIPSPQIHRSVDSMPYYPGYQGADLTPRGGTGTVEYRDLNSFAQVNPITYWEQQQRLRPTVDDGLNFLTEPYTKFEDVSTTPSVMESTLIDEDGQESAITESEFGGVIGRPITSRGVHHKHGVLSKFPQSRWNGERDSVSSFDKEISTQEVEEEESNRHTSGCTITHFPSADCTTPLTSSEDGNVWNQPQH